MADWTYQSNDVLTNRRWAKLMLSQFMSDTWFLRMASKEDTSMIQILDDLSKHAGDSVTFGVSKLLSGPGVLDLNTLTGNEEAPQTYGDTLFIHELAHAVLLVGPISNQRVLFDRRKIGRNRLADWYAARVDHGAANQLAGYVPQSDTRFTGLQAPTAATRQILPTGVTDAASITSSHPFLITYLDEAVLRAKSLTTGIRPLKVAGRVRTNTTTGQWLDIQKAAMTGGDIGDNPIFWNAIGMYHGVLLHENSRVTNSVANAGTAVANTKRALFCGAQAAALAFGRGEGDSQKFRWLEELRDFGRQIGIGVSAIWGLKKTVFNSSDFATVVIDTYGLDIDTLGAAATNAQ
jgi:N4-gp56 family major capsid protein